MRYVGNMKVELLVFITAFLSVHGASVSSISDLNFTTGLLSIFPGEERCTQKDGCENAPETCSVLRHGLEMFCVRSCDVDSDCEKHMFCSKTPWLNFCFFRPCENDNHCVDNTICNGGVCVRPCHCNNNGTCRYEKQRKICECEKRSEEIDGICQKTCANAEDCKNGGVCEEKGGYKSCSCKSGVIGDYCETVFDCTPDGKYKNCKSSDGMCFYDGTKAICECPRRKIPNDNQTFCEARCKQRGAILYSLGKGKEQFCLKMCSSDSSCGKDQKCANTTGLFSRLCARKCDVDDDCEYPTKCNRKGKYCFWEKCKSNDDCQDSLTCSPAPYMKEKFCSRRGCYKNDTECEDNQICNLKTRACECANGMGGRKCEIIESCKENGKFKDCKGVNGTCEYNKNERVIICRCAHGKKPHPEENRCRETCDNVADCKNGGVCEEKGGYKFCSCKLGVTGDKCETVFDCTPDGKYKDCESSGGKCYYDGNKAICECPANKKLNDKKLVCEACVCRGGECVIEEGKKGCKCPPGYGNFTNLSCRACDCGSNTSCIWEARFGGNKICLCKPGYSTKKGKCAACECGPDSNCEWISEGWLKPEKKVCHCKLGYYVENGKCVDKQDIGKS